MSVLEIADFGERRKAQVQIRPVDSRPLAGLLAMHRWGRISIEQYALARRISNQRAVTTLRKFKDDGLVTAIRTTREGISGVGVMLYGLTAVGHELLQDEHPEIGEHRSPRRAVQQTSKFWHRQDTISALISAHALLPDCGVHVVSEQADFEIRKSATSAAPTAMRVGDETLIPDAILDTEDDDGHAARYLIEIDRGTETIASLSPRQRGKTLVDMFARYWRFLSSAEDAARHRILFIANRQSRIDRVLADVPWAEMGSDADRFFRLGFYDDVVGCVGSKQKRIYGNFWGAVWKRPGHDGFTPLLRVSA